VRSLVPDGADIDSPRSSSVVNFENQALNMDEVETRMNANALGKHPWNGSTSVETDSLRKDHYYVSMGKQAQIMNDQTFS